MALFRKISCLLIVFSLTFFIQFAVAQEDQFQLEEITVTAQKREQSVQDVSISMNVLLSEEIEKAGIVDVRSLNVLAPDFVAIEDLNATRISMRGISTLSNDEAQDQALTVNIDGEYINNGRVLNVGWFDVERIEVLRGPQGSLYGRNATGGAINIVTRKPDLGEFSGEISVDIGDYDARRVNAAVNVPLGGIAAIRLAVNVNQRDGYNEHPNFGGKASGDVDNKAGRLSLEIEPTDALSIYLAGETSNLDNLSNAYATINFNQAPYLANNPTGANNGINCDGAGWEFLQNVEGGGVACVPTTANYLGSINRNKYDGPITGTLGSHETDSDAFRGRVDYDFGGATLTYQGGYRKTTIDTAEALPDFIFYRNYDVKTMSHELRLSGGDDGGFFWQGGLFYFDEEMDFKGGLYSPFIAGGAFLNGFYRPDFESTSLAVFGQVEVPLGEDYTLVVGARYTKDEKSVTFINQGFGFPPGNPADLRPINPATDAIFPMDFDDSAFTGNIGLNWDITDDTMLYAKVSSGYKAGGFDAVDEYDSETVLAYEVGAKFKGSRTTLNGSAFYYDYDDLQASVLLDTTKGGQIFNAGAVTIWGAEASFEYMLTSNDRVALSANYLNAEYDQFDASIPVQCVGCNLNAVPGDVDGNTPQDAPEWILTFGYDRVFDLPNGSTITGSLFSRYKDDYYTTIYNYAGSMQDGYTQTDLNVEYATAKGNFSILAYVRNIEDERQVTYSVFISAGPADAYNYAFGAPRTFGVQAKFKF